MNTNTIIYILMAVAVLAGAYLAFTNDDVPETENVPADTEIAPADSEAPEATENTTDTEAEADETTSRDPESTAAPQGNDFGMEYPVPDEEVEVEAGGEAEAEVSGEPQVFTLDAFNYGYSQEELRVSEGDTVTIMLTNSGGFHDWVLDEFDAATDRINEGETATVTFEADEAGVYEFYCSVGNHRQQGMVGTLIVE